MISLLTRATKHLYKVYRVALCCTVNLCDVVTHEGYKTPVQGVPVLHCVVQSICVMSLLTRATKHLYKVYMQGVDMMNLAASISHFLNCYLGSFPTPHTQVAVEETVSVYKCDFISFICITPVSCCSCLGFCAFWHVYS